MTISNVLALLSLVVFVPFSARAEREASPRGQSATTLGEKWVEVDYGRPILRGRKDIFGSGAEFGKTVNGGAPVWRAGANETTRLTTEVALKVGDKKLEPGAYDLFVELKEGKWTLIVSTQPAKTVGDKSKGKGKIWGSYGYDPKFDVVRVPMNLSKSDASIDELTIGFVDVSATGGSLQMAWDHTVATVPFTVAP